MFLWYFSNIQFLVFIINRPQVLLLVKWLSLCLFDNSFESDYIWAALSASLIWLDQYDWIHSLPCIVFRVIKSCLSTIRESGLSSNLLSNHHLGELWCACSIIHRTNVIHHTVIYHTVIYQMRIINNLVNDDVFLLSVERREL